MICKPRVKKHASFWVVYKWNDESERWAYNRWIDRWEDAIKDALDHPAALKDQP